MNIFRSSRLQMFFKIGALKKFAISWIKKWRQQLFSYEYYEIFKNFDRTSPVSASAFLKSN